MTRKLRKGEWRSGGAPETGTVFYDCTHYKVHQDANGPGTNEDQSIGKSRGVPSTKLHRAVDMAGRPAARVIPTLLNISEHTVASEPTAGLTAPAAVGKWFMAAKNIAEDGK